MELFEKFNAHIRSENLFSRNDRLILAVSGGVDSVVLCELCRQAGFNFTIAHCNFQLRGKESDRDEVFVRELGEKLGVKVHIRKFDTGKFAEDNKLSIQEAARKLRYEWFAELIEEARSNSNSVTGGGGPTSHLLLTAHHLDDNIETLLQNFFRGTGMKGLAGMPSINRFTRRPLLNFSKDELIGFAGQHQLSWVEDSSNSSSDYTRNYFRNELIPGIEKVFPQVRENLAANLERFREIERLYQYSVGQLKKKLCRIKAGETWIPIRQLVSFNNRALVYEIFSEFGFQEKQLDEIIKLTRSNSGSSLSASRGDYRVIRHRHWLIITPVNTLDSRNIIIGENEKEIVFPGGRLNFGESHASQYKIPTANLVAALDLANIRFPLLLRPWKEGDYFYPLGMRKKKKLSRFFIDQKFSKPQKEKTWVLESGQRIIWVVGHRIDDRFKLDEQSGQVLEIRFLPAEQAGIL